MKPHDSLKFRPRGEAMSRLDAFSDVVFGFAITLLVVSLEVPHTYDELMVAMRGFLPFAICFALVILIWHEHFVFFRRYNLHDALTVTLNSTLLFLIVFYVYPLKFVFSLATNQIRQRPGEVVIRAENVPPLFTLYALGFAAVYVIFAAMYYRALAKKDDLELNELEVFDTKEKITEHLLMVFIGLTSALFASYLRGERAALSACVYYSIPLVLTIHGMVQGKRRRKIEERVPPRASATLSGSAETDSTQPATAPGRSEAVDG